MYGIYVTTLAYCLRWLLFGDEGWKPRRRISLPMITISILLFLLSTTDLALTLESMVDDNDGQTLLWYARILAPIEDTTLMITDGVLIYRCWVVYRKSWCIIYLPIALWLGCLACAILRPYYFTILLRPYGTDSTLSRLLHVMDTFYACNIAINLYATFLIVYQVLRVAHECNASGRVRHLYRATRIIAESGILYTLTSILNLVGSLLSQVPRLHTLQAVADSINFSTAGIAFNLILIRVGQNQSDVDENHPGVQKIIKEDISTGQLSTLQFNAIIAMSQGQSLTDMEEGIQKS